MNIFYLDHDFELAAKYHNDKHVVKMILESAQLLSTAHRVLDGTVTIERKNERNLKRWKLDSQFETVYYGATHVNHPSAIWCRESCENYIWLYGLYDSLLEEYTHRYHKIHKCASMRDALRRIPNNMNLNNDWDQPPQAMPDDCKVEGNSVQAYRNYYTKYKVRMAKWTNREKPEWWKDADF